MDSLTSNARTVVPRAAGLLGLPFFSDTLLPVGTVVTLLNNGKIAALKEGTQAGQILGYVSVPNPALDETATVNVLLAATIKGKAKGAITAADYVKADGITGTAPNTYATFKSVSPGDTAHALALETAANGEDVLIGLFYQQSVLGVS